ncbi:hypothetical protein J4E91_008084 [Alternaria rosae]|nr:hypothetical protein J4E91_008084 [Alternaria rosae]
MATTTQSDGFLTLPAELQVKIYGYVLAAARKAPGPGNLALYAGLLLSCKKVASDFDQESHQAEPPLGLTSGRKKYTVLLHRFPNVNTPSMASMEVRAIMVGV